jgi:hypothetical protein
MHDGGELQTSKSNQSGTDDDEEALEVTLKDAAASVLVGTGSKGMHGKELAALISEQELYKWIYAKRPENSVAWACLKNPAIFVKVAPCTFALQVEMHDGGELQTSKSNQSGTDDDEEALEVTLKDAAAIGLVGTGSKGMHGKELAALISEQELYNWKHVKSPEDSVASACRSNPAIFVKVAPCTFALREEMHEGDELQTSKRNQSGTDKEEKVLLPGEVVWAKVASFPWWPAQVEIPKEKHKRLRHKKNDVFVVFFGENQFQWLPRDKVEPWRCPEYSERMRTKNKDAQKAIKEALVDIQILQVNPTHSIPQSEPINESSRGRSGQQVSNASSILQDADSSGTKRTREASVGPKHRESPKKIPKVSSPKSQDTRVTLVAAEPGGIGVNQKGGERLANLVQVDAHEMECFHCKAKETPKWHVFRGVVSCVRPMLCFAFFFESLNFHRIEWID